MYPAGREVCCAVMTRFIPSCAQGVWQAGELLRELICGDGYPGGWLSDALGVPAVYSGHKLFCVGCTM